MQLHPRMLFWAAVLDCALSSQIGVMAVPPQSPNRADLQLFLTTFGKGDSPAVLQATGLTVLVDKTPAQVKGVRSSKDDPLPLRIINDMVK